MIQKEAAIKKAAEDMKFYKLELINREQSYNAMFGAQPSVGFMNPTNKMVKQPQMAPIVPVNEKQVNRKNTQKPLAI